jgi:glucosamine--fructose-6-phosphate aminotransferase (isomerizing)
MPVSDRDRYIREILALPGKIREILKLEEKIKEVAEEYSLATNFLFTGRKFSAIVALEGALKLKEITWSNTSGVNAFGVAGGEMKHGTLAMINNDFPTIAIVPYDSVYQATINNLREIKSKGGPVIILTTNDAPNELNELGNVFAVPSTLEVLSPILNVILPQLFAYHSALLRGVSPDEPRNLAKAVTVE